MTTSSSPGRLLGANGEGILAGMRAGLAFLDSHDPAGLLERVGRTVEEVPPVTPVDKTALQDSYGGRQTAPCDDLLVGRGLFYLTEQRRLCLDCTSGHYQMLWGYNHPALCAAVAEATAAGIVWDNHANIPQTPLKQLAHRLVAAANAPGEPDPIDTVLLGCCTGSVACEAALKLQLLRFERRRGRRLAPAFVVLDGNYHGTDMVPQYLRGLWGRYVRHIDVVTVQPNDAAELQAAFGRCGERAAAFWAEPVMMNREAVPLEPGYLQLARRLCDDAGAALCMDEIQTGFWQPEIFSYRTMGFTPDMVVAGKGMTAGFHPLAAVLYRTRDDVMDQYQAINTNGSAPLPAYVALRVMDMVAAQAGRIAATGDRFMEGLSALAGEFPDVLVDARGKRHLAGLKFRRVDEAIGFHRRAVEAGLWVRVHAYHEGHSTILTKLGLAADEQIVDFIMERFRSLLRE